MASHTDQSLPISKKKFSLFVPEIHMRALYSVFQPEKGKKSKNLARKYLFNDESHKNETYFFEIISSRRVRSCVTWRHDCDPNSRFAIFSCNRVLYRAVRFHIFFIYTLCVFFFIVLSPIIFLQRSLIIC